jgi:hypothetical protein
MLDLLREKNGTLDVYAMTLVREEAEQSLHIVDVGHRGLIATTASVTHIFLLMTKRVSLCGNETAQE